MGILKTGRLGALGLLLFVYPRKKVVGWAGYWGVRITWMVTLLKRSFRVRHDPSWRGVISNLLPEFSSSAYFGLSGECPIDVNFAS